MHERRFSKSARYWLAAVLTYGVIFVATGHAGLFLLVAVPVVLFHAFEADPPVLVLSLLAITSVILFLGCGFRRATSLAVAAFLPWLALTLLTVSAVIALVISETPVLSLVSAIPFIAMVTGAFLITGPHLAKEV